MTARLRSSTTLARLSSYIRSGRLPDNVDIGMFGPSPEIPFIIQKGLSGFDHKCIILLLENNHAALPKMQDIPYFLGKCDLAFRCNLRGNAHIASSYPGCCSLLLIIANVPYIIKRKYGQGGVSLAGKTVGCMR